ncbi:stimulated by retinoic acid gene 8 protein homolog isoform X2 [Rhineura floridana]|nr:stimulated by retinoic acid gene 8 protein homolog isoform X2 [Rhineura floridana]XP_061438812.1 stimulated by retinoic acid gene 8 protein homolog isoform X2 [Rhineura floridana]XP_061438814.1 stimulated by retinoic acid gene 8 protein homolog isoform X2 [Rhineura floridana]XP_061438815.1 stimulated by retinoic acid gene 8 protein homolog isoform X2 [Rhineura floridana]
METSGDCSTPYARVTPKYHTYLQDPKPQAGKRRLSQARHRATLAGLFNNLRETVYSQQDNSASKCQVLCKAQNYIQELEQTLENLLKMKEVLNLEDGNPSSLEEVKEEYVKMYFNNQNAVSPSNAMSQNGATVWYVIQEQEKSSVEEDVTLRLTQSPATSSPDLMEFERYLYFYKQTVDLLVDNGVVSSEDVTLPVISTAVSHLWQGLPEEKRDSVLQYCSQRQNFITEVKTASQEPPCTEGSVRDSGASQEASGSLVSTPEEILFEDAFEVATSFLDRNETREMSSQSSAFTGCASQSQEDNHHLYLQIISFLKSLFFANTQPPQEEVLQLDYETVMLRCTETFDDEDL